MNAEQKQGLRIKHLAQAVNECYKEAGLPKQQYFFRRLKKQWGKN